MAKIESIRPGGTLESNLGAYPFADLLLGVLRGNLTGRLDLSILSDRGSCIFFKDGVPVSVDLPPLGASGLFDDANGRRAREQVVRLFNAGPVAFRFTEGEVLPRDATLTILQPLPIVFEGLLKSKERKPVIHFIAEHGAAQFKLAATYPSGVDPFEWGARVEEIIGTLKEPGSLLDLERRGLGGEIAEVALTTLFLAGMLELQRTPYPSLSRGSQPSGAAHAPLEPPLSLRAPAHGARGAPESAVSGRIPSRDQESDDRDPSGLVIHRRFTGRFERVKCATPMPEQASPQTRPQTPMQPPSPQPHEAQLQQISMRLGALRGKSYYMMLRVSENAPADQVERSFRYLVRQREDGSDDPADRALRDVLREARDTLVGKEAARYRELSERAKLSSLAVSERQAFEASPKIDRALRAMAEGRIPEATYLLDWAGALDPTRRDVRVYRGLLAYFRAPKTNRAIEANALRPSVQAELQRSPQDWRLRLTSALLLAEGGESQAARQIVDSTPDADHPLVRKIRELLMTRT